MLEIDELKRVFLDQAWKLQGMIDEGDPYLNAKEKTLVPIKIRRVDPTAFLVHIAEVDFTYEAIVLSKGEKFTVQEEDLGLLLTSSHMIYRYIAEKIYALQSANGYSFPEKQKSMIGRLIDYVKG